MGDADALLSDLAKGLRVLAALAEGPRGPTEIARETGLTTSSAHRTLGRLVATGHARRAGAGYAATLRLWQEGRRGIEALGLRAPLRPVLERLAARSEHTAFLAVREGLHVVYLDSVMGRTPERSWVRVGGRQPIATVGTGKVLLAASYEALRPDVLGTLTAHTPYSITDGAALDAEIAAIRQDGYAVDRGERVADTWGVAAPIGSPARAAFGLAVPAVRIDDATLARCIAEVRAAATAGERALAGG
ncbi:MAG: IclR family transcriptional regulator [Shimia sp.]